MVIDVIIANRAIHNSVWLKTSFGIISECNSSRLNRSETENILKEPFPNFNLLSKPVVEPHLSTSVEFVGLFSIEFDFIQQTCQIPASHWKLISIDVVFVTDDLSVIWKSKTFLNSYIKRDHFYLRAHSVCQNAAKIINDPMIYNQQPIVFAG